MVFLWFSMTMPFKSIPNSTETDLDLRIPRVDAQVSAWFGDANDPEMRTDITKEVEVQGKLREVGGNSRENHGKTIGKSWENHGKTIGKFWFSRNL